jgi:hypothetical protein
VLAVIAYLEKLEELGMRKANNLVLERDREADKKEEESM